MKPVSIAAPLYVCYVKEKYDEIKKGEEIPKCFKECQQGEEILICLMFQLIHTLYECLDNSEKIIGIINSYFRSEYPSLVNKNQSRFKEYLNALDEGLKRGTGVDKLYFKMCKNIMNTENVGAVDAFEIASYFTAESSAIQSTILCDTTIYDIKKHISKSNVNKVKQKFKKTNIFVCKHCGEKNDYTDNFCTNCGNPLSFSKNK